MFGFFIAFKASTINYNTSIANCGCTYFICSKLSLVAFFSIGHFVRGMSLALTFPRIFIHILSRIVSRIIRFHLISSEPIDNIHALHFTMHTTLPSCVWLRFQFAAIVWNIAILFKWKSNELINLLLFLRSFVRSFAFFPNGFCCSSVCRWQMNTRNR